MLTRLQIKLAPWTSHRATCQDLAWGLFLESPEAFRAYFGWHNSLCIFKTKASRGTKLCSYFYFCSLYNILKDQLYRISRSQFYEWLFGPEKFSGLSRNGPLVANEQNDDLNLLCFLSVFTNARDNPKLRSVHWCYLFWGGIEMEQAWCSLSMIVTFSEHKKLA